MRIGFDLDGVLATQDVTVIILIRDKGEFAEDQYAGTLRPQLYPSMFLGKNDTAVIITARMARLNLVTKEWCKLHFPSYKLFHVKVPQWLTTHPSDIKKWQNEVSRRKARLINKLQVEVYFEDMPDTVEQLRKLCPNCKIIQYGGRVR